MRQPDGVRGAPISRFRAVGGPLLITLAVVELRAEQGHAVLVEDGCSDAHVVSAQHPPLPQGLTSALEEWAKVADAVVRAGQRGVGPSTTELVSRRGEQLAARLAGVVGRAIRYADPLLGEVREVQVPLPRPATTRRPRPYPPRRWERVAEPTPWGTGVAVSGFVAVLVVLAVVSISLGLAETSSFLSVGANVLIGVGLAPSVWLARQVPIWRWVAFGVAAGILLAWFGLLLTLLR